LSFEGAKIIGKELSGIKNWQKPVGLFLVALNDECTELKLVWLELSGHEDSEYVRMIFYHACEQNGNEKYLSTLKKLYVMK
jgi:hypothetical protein